jgi:hypothetical protein
MSYCEVIDEVEEFYRIVRLMPLRKTEGVLFDTIPISVFGRIDAIDRVVHDSGAISPGRVGDVKRPWYMHPSQDDHLMVLCGKRVVELYSRKYNQLLEFEITPEYVKKNGKVVFEGQAVVCWPRHVFHRVESSHEVGSYSLNFAVHHEAFDIATNFNIYELNTDSGEFKEIRRGELDQ